VFDASQPPILELVHPSPVQQCRDVIATAAALQQYVGRFFANGARPDGVIQAPGHISQDTATRLQTQWNTGYRRTGTTHRGVAVMGDGLTFEPIASANDDAQLIETMRALSVQIAGAFRVPPWKIGDLNNANYSNMETGENMYITGTLDPYFECWESAVRRDLLTVRQYGAYTITFDRSTLIRNDVKSLHESLAVGRNTGIYSVNDCRRKLGENPIGPEGDQYLVNSALQPVGATPNEPTIA
jgi:HK97 family phage portal protein